MRLARAAVERPLATVALSLGLLIMGSVLLLRLPVSLFPDVRLPFFTVRIVVPGAPASDLELSVAKVLEPELAKIAGLNRQITFVRPNGVEFILGFRFGLSESEASAQVRQALDRVRPLLPPDSRPPEIRTVDASRTPVLIAALRSEPTEEDAERLLQRVTALGGVAAAEFLGSSVRDFWVRLDTEALATLRISPLDVFRALQEKLARAPLGLLDVPKEKSLVPVSASGQQTELMLALQGDEPLRLELGQGRSLLLSEVANIARERHGDDEKVFLSGEPSLALAVYRRSDANTLDVVDTVGRKLSQWSKDAGIPTVSVLDQSKHIRENASEVWIALLWGGLFAVFTVIVALKDWRSGIITGTALPVSILGTMVGLYALGFSLNTLTLLALALAIGLLIDDAVVVRESIGRQLEAGKPAKQAALDGTRRVFSPVVATTICIVAIFAPVAAMQGLVGQFFREFGLTICIAVVLSNLVAFTLDPMLSAYFFKGQRAKGSQRPEKASLRSRAMTILLGTVDWSFQRPLRVLAAASLAFALSLYLSFRDGVDFMAPEDRDQLLVEMIARPGETAQSFESRVLSAASAMRDLEPVEATFSVIGEGNDKNRALVRTLLLPKSKREQSHLEVARSMREGLAAQGFEALVKEPPPIEGVGGEPPLSLYLYGDNLSELHEKARAVLATLAAIPGTGSAVIDTAGMGKELAISADFARAREAGLTPEGILGLGRLLLSGLPLGRLPEIGAPGARERESSAGPSGRDLWMGIRADQRNPESLQALLSALSPPGASPDSWFDFEEEQRASAIDREKGRRKVVLYGSPDGSRPFSEVLAAWEQVAKTVDAPFAAELGGDREIFSEMLGSFGFALAGGLLCIIIVLIVFYESLWMPLVIFLGLPFATLGGLMALSVGEGRLAMGSLIGMILLLGLSAKNGILLVDEVSRASRAFGWRKATLYAVKVRTRPILMTSIALLAGMLPTVFLGGAGSEFRSPMALSIMGGVVSGTLLSFFCIPALIALFSRAFMNKKRALSS